MRFAWCKNDREIPFKKMSNLCWCTGWLIIVPILIYDRFGFEAAASPGKIFATDMATDIKMSDKQYLAKILFTREKLEQKIIAQKVGVSEKTISKWVHEFAWKKLRNRLLVSKEEILNDLYEQLENLHNSIRTKDIGHQFADTKEADIQIKYTASIRNLETDLAIADLVESGIRFIKHLQVVGTFEQVLEVAELWNSFLLASFKKS